MTIADALRSGVRALTGAGIDDPARDARRLLAYALRLAPERLTPALPDPLPLEAAARFDAALFARMQRRPVAQIVGTRLFWGRAFRVTEAVLDPRPETEALVAAALEARFDSVLDLGTGSGAILLTLMAETGAAGIGTDISDATLAVARANADTLGLAPDLRRADWFDGVAGRFDLIVSNPPYIPAAEVASLAPEVREWEPRGALTDGGDGLSAYRAIAAGAARHLAPGGRVIVEHGAGQSDSVCAIFAAAGFATEPRPDLDGRARAIIARLA